MLTTTLPAALLALTATGAVYTGVAFINAQLLPAWLDSVYAATGAFTRAMIFLVLLATPANFMISGVYRLTDPGIAAVLLTASLAIVLTAKALLLGVDGLGWRTGAAALATALSLIWLSWELGRHAH